MRSRPLLSACLVICVTSPILAACSGPGASTTGLPADDALATGGAGDSGRSILYHGCPVFAEGDYYSAVVRRAPADSKSSAYIQSAIQAGDTYGFFASTGVEQVNLANDTAPKLRVHPKVNYHHFPVPYPWRSSFFIEPLGDHHAMVVQYQTCHLYESYSTSYNIGKLSAYSGANWDMRKRLRPLRRGTPSAMASGLPLFAGTVRWEDYKSNCICHALDWAGIAHTVSQYGFVTPASDTDRLPFQGNSTYALPYGAHLRLKASFSTAGWGAQAAMVATAMKTYGIYLADTGSSSNALYFANADDGTNPWDWSDLSALSKIHLSDFEVLKLPPIRYVR